MKTTILMLGGGYTTVWAYKSLERKLSGKLKSGRVEILVVAPNKCHSFHGFCGEVVAGLLPVQATLTPLAKIMKHARFIDGWVESIDAKEHTATVKLMAENKYVVLRYDELVIGVGMKDNEETVSGLKEFGHGVKNDGALEECRKKIIMSLEAASTITSDTLRKKYLTFVIAGAGPAGVEFCTNLAEFIHAAGKKLPALKNTRPEIVLVHSGAEPMPAFSIGRGKLIRYCTTQLKMSGVRFLTNTRVTEVTREGAWLSDDSFIASNMVVSIIGQKTIPIRGMESFSHEKTKRIAVTSFLNLESAAHVWAGGDAAHVMHINGEYVCPPNALWAIKHGELIGNNIAWKLNGKKPGKFSYRGLGQAASLGVGKAVGELYGIELTGWLPWIMRMIVFLRFMPLRSQAMTVGFRFIRSILTGRIIPV